jgi:raffinose/stachyose/melibiose transport system permease protein
MAEAVGRSPRRARVWWPVWFLLPPVALFAGLVVLPIVLAVLLSFCTWNGTSAIHYTGMANWHQFIHDPSALAALERTFVLVIASWLIQEPIALALGLFAAGHQRHRALFSAIYFLPMLISAAALGILWGLLLSPVNGGVTYASTHFGLSFLDRQWLGDPNLVMATVIVLVAWEFIPFHSLLYEAGARQIPKSIYEAAAIDGIGPYRKFFRITLPMLRYTLVTSSTLNLVGSLTVFDLIYTLTGGGPGQSTRVLALAQYLEGFESLDFGYASTLAIVLGILAVIVSLLLIGLTGFGKMRSQAEGA